MTFQTVFSYFHILNLLKVKSNTIDSSFYSNNNISELFTDIKFSSSRIGTIDALASILNVPQIEKVLSHGCWCSGLKSGSNSNLLGNYEYLQTVANTRIHLHA